MTQSEFVSMGTGRRWREESVRVHVPPIRRLKRGERVTPGSFSGSVADLQFKKMVLLVSPGENKARRQQKRKATLNIS